MAYPEGYRKAMRVMELANRHGFPLLTLVDTPGAYPGIAAEQHGQGGAIARSQAMMARLDIPTVANDPAMDPSLRRMARKWLARG
jgi:acetyl-CoA carboxylase carboxyl transferase subunit alpha